MNYLVRTLVASALLAGGCQSSNTTTPPPASLQTAAGTPADLVDFVGARAGQAEMGLGNLGYKLAKTEGLTSYWWNGATKTCAKIVTSDGRYQAIETAAPGECPQ